MRYLFLLPFLFLTCSQNTIQKNNQTQPELKKIQLFLDNLEKDAFFKSGTIAFHLQSLRNTEITIQKNAEKSLIPASCLKVITTAAAYEILGENYKFETHLQYSGTINNGVLEGNIYVKGFGDPTLASNLIRNASTLDENCSKWKTKILGFGIKKIKGQIIFDDSEYPTDIMPAEWIWGDMGNYFGSPACAFNVFDNQYNLVLKPAEKLDGKPTIIKTFPDISKQIQFVNELVTAEAGTGDLSTINGHIYDKYRYLNGSIPLGNTITIRGAMPDPAFFLANYFHNYLQGKITITENPTTTRLINSSKNQQKRVHLSKFHSNNTLKEIIKYTNFYSSNLFAEAILKRIGAKKMRKASTNAGTKSLKDFWQSQGIDTEGMVLKDGSGLARSNLVTATQFTKILVITSKKKYFNEFYQSLPLSKKQGTMVNIGKNIDDKYELRAKTGGMSRVFALTGYFKNAQKETFAFTLIFNNYTCKDDYLKKKLDSFLKIMVENS